MLDILGLKTCVMKKQECVVVVQAQIKGVLGGLGESVLQEMPQCSTILWYKMKTSVFSLCRTTPVGVS